MRNKLFFLALLVLATALNATFDIDPDEYRMKVGDSFLVHIMSSDSMRVFIPVLPEGIVKVPPLTDAIKVTGMTLNEAKAAMEEQLNKSVRQGYVSIMLYSIAPPNYHVTGAVAFPGEYTPETTVNLYNALKLCGGLLPYSSRKVEITRNGKKTVYDLRKYLSDGDITQNPLIQEDDIIHVPFANDYAKVFVSNDTTYYVEYYELDKEMSTSELLQNLSQKNHWSELDHITAFRNGEMIKTNMDFLVEPNDSIFVSVEAAFVYVTGNVPKPGKYPYVSGGAVMQYVSKAGGLLNTGSLSKIRVYRPDGRELDLDTEAIRPGDTVHVPQNLLSMMQSYLTTLSIIAGIVSSAILINANIK